MATLSEQLESCRERNVSLSKQLHDLQQSRIQLYLAYGTGVVFVLLLLYLALSVSEPSQWQYTIFRTVLSLAAGGIAAILPGDLEIRYKNLVRATGAVGVFVLVYQVNPAALAGIPEPLPTQSYSFKILSKRADQAALNCFSLPYSDVTGVVRKGRLFAVVEDYGNKYGNFKFEPTRYAFFRKSDEKEITDEKDALAPRNDGLVIIERELITKQNGPHVLFTMANTMPCH